MSFPLSPTILLVTPQRRDQRLLSKALAATGCRVQAVESSDEALQVLASQGIDLVVADYDLPKNPSDANRFEHFLYQASQHTAGAWVTGEAKVLLLADRRDKDDLQRLFELEFLTNLLAKNHPVNLDELIVTVGKIVRNDIFGISKYLCYGVRPVTHQVRSSRDRDGLLAALENYAQGLGIQRRLVSVAKSVADELIMNAVYNAPVRRDGTRPYASLPRTQTVDLQPHEYCYLTYACDGRQLVVSIQDQFGSLRAHTVRAYLKRCFAMGQDQIEAKQGGAGMGLYFIVEALNTIIINISPGRGTEIIGTIDVSGSYRDYVGKNKSFHIFVA